MEITVQCGWSGLVRSKDTRIPGRGTTASTKSRSRK
jgi:hypothetical protein